MDDSIATIESLRDQLEGERDARTTTEENLCTAEENVRNLTGANVKEMNRLEIQLEASTHHGMELKAEIEVSYSTLWDQ